MQEVSGLFALHGRQISEGSWRAGLQRDTDLGACAGQGERHSGIAMQLKITRCPDKSLLVRKCLNSGSQPSSQLLCTTAETQIRKVYT